MNVCKGFVYETAKITPQTRVELAEDSWIGDFVFVHLSRLRLGRGSQVNPFASLTGGGEVLVGDYSVIGYGVRIISGTDTPEAEYMADRAPESGRRVVCGTVKLGNNCFIGANAVVCVSRRTPNIKIGDNTVIGALSYIGKNVPKDTVGWGTPYTAIRNRKA
jgi:acetyltransferase-like isoleucine patch superfamily enzyme